MASRLNFEIGLLSYGLLPPRGVLMNDGNGDPIILRRGLRHGDTLSPLIAAFPMTL